MRDGKLVFDVFREVEREKEPWPIGCFPRAFSLMLRDCRGTASSVMLADALEWGENEERPSSATSLASASCSSSSSSPPIAKVPSSGTLPS